MIVILGAIAVTLTLVMFRSKEPMLGFACVIFWSLFGAQCINLAVYDWDIYFTTGFGALLGMNILCGMGAFQFFKGSRKGREDSDFIDKDDGTQYLGESKSEARRAENLDNDDSMSESNDDSMDRPSQPSARTKELRERARKRKTGLFRKKPRWGEFK